MDAKGRWGMRIESLLTGSRMSFYLPVWFVWCGVVWSWSIAVNSLAKSRLKWSQLRESTVLVYTRSVGIDYLLLMNDLEPDI